MFENQRLVGRKKTNLKAGEFKKVELILPMPSASCVTLDKSPNSLGLSCILSVKRGD